MPVRVGVIGVGRWGQNHVRIYRELGCSLAGVSDTNPAVEEIAGELGIRYFPDYRELLPNVDAVSVVVPTNAHYRVVKDCLEAGKHVLVEKPLTLDSSEALDLIKTARRKRLVLMVGYLFRYNAAVTELKRQLRTAGDISYITARYIHSNKPPRKDCGVIFNFATHLIDILNFLLDEKPKSVFCRKINCLSKEREDCAFVLLEYRNFSACLEVTWLHPLKKRDMWIIGSKEKIYADFLEQMITRYPIVVTQDKVESGKEVNVDIRKNEPLKEEIKSFVGAVESGRMVDAEDEYMITRICEKCIESSESGRKAEVGP